MARTDNKISLCNLIPLACEERVLPASPSSSPQRLAVVSPHTAMVTIPDISFHSVVLSQHCVHFPSAEWTVVRSCTRYNSTACIYWMIWISTRTRLVTFILSDTL